MTLLFAMASGTKIVFEEIGHMAGALSYQHVVIPVNLTSLFLQANSLDGVIHFYEDQICATFDNANATMYKSIEKAQDYAYINGVLNIINMAGQYNISNTHCQNMKLLRSKIPDLMELLPNVDATREENAIQYNCHKWFVKTFLQEDE